MIDWWRIASNGLWILGVSLLLTAFSYHDWLAKTTGARRRDLLSRRSWRVPSALSMVLICSGWGLAQADRVWQKSLWAALAAWFAWDLLDTIRSAVRKPDAPDVLE